MSRGAIEQLLYSLDASFEGSHHSLLANLATVPAGDWERQPPGRSTISARCWRAGTAGHGSRSRESTAAGGMMSGRG